MKPSEAMWKAADYVEAGWCQEALEYNGKFCMLGALNKAIYGHSFSFDGVHTPENNRVGFVCRRTVQEVIREQIGNYDMVAFNNAPSRRQEEVVVMLQKVAAKLEEQGQ